MQFRHILITGGAGFAGSSIATLFKEHFENIRVTALDSLMRRGSELNLACLKKSGVEFIHGDVRCREDLHAVEKFDLLIDCAAEPSVHAGTSGSPRKVIDINLTGTTNCLESARENEAAVLFLSTSRVYPIRLARSLKYTESKTRFELAAEQDFPGASSAGIAENFPLEGARSFYGATKLASELFLQEYVYNCGMPGLINRCGLLTGPRQMGRVDQGVITLWLARHIYGKPLKYIGFGGTGKQVRDLLHIRDLFELIVKQTGQPDGWDGSVFNAGGGRAVSVSLKELTAFCREITGKEVPVTPQPETSSVDIPVYLTDNTKAGKQFGWKPVRGVEETLRDIAGWIEADKKELESILA